MTRKRPIGSAGQAVLARLIHAGGTWTKRDGALWESQYWTTTILGALAAKGLVREIVQGEQYEVTPEGRRRSTEFAVSIFKSNRK